MSNLIKISTLLILGLLACDDDSSMNTVIVDPVIPLEKGDREFGVNISTSPIWRGSYFRDLIQ